MYHIPLMNSHKSGNGIDSVKNFHKVYYERIKQRQAGVIPTCLYRYDHSRVVRSVTTLQNRYLRLPSPSGRSPAQRVRPESEETPRPAKGPRQRRGTVPKGVFLSCLNSAKSILKAMNDIINLLADISTFGNVFVFKGLDTVIHN